ncbi:MAG: single-stranded-DNA-specific exonuclease RecJ [Rickettsiales bacterium]|nr:single-stranded-DNA-specific exonuclease RecJ [Rickettsiales bacterium]OUW05430.1 MAG: single-stranded-DNA-specific exonuclease RecJ [Betaproteobacteria bacterium TMED156]
MKILNRKSDRLIEELLITNGTCPLLAKLLSKRKIKSIDDMDMSLNKLLSPWKMMNINKASRLVGESVLRKKKILVVADFDADGATGCAVAILGLKKFNLDVEFIVPDRFIFGYGLTSSLVLNTVENLKKNKKKLPDLLITVDNGISSHDGVKVAKKLGIEVLITDHHLPGTELPDAMIVNPQQKDCNFESKNIAGVGVIFYLLIATRTWLRDRGYFNNSQEPKLDDLLSLVALGTIADLVPLDTNNRRIIFQGLQRIHDNNIPEGLRALIKISKLSPKTVTCSDLGFKIAPKLNAAGRLSDMSLGIHCLTEKNKDMAMGYAYQLENLNRKRRQMETQSRKEGINLLIKNESLNQGLGTVIFKKNWHQGIVGLIASKVKDLISKPTIVFAYQNENCNLLKGSGRSIQGVHLRDVLERIHSKNPKLINTFGGHAMAAGITIQENKLDEFKRAFNESLEEIVDKSVFSPDLITDGKIDLKRISLSSVLEIESSIWGQAFDTPLFWDEFIIHEQKVLKDNHLKLVISQTSNIKAKYSGIWFDAPKFNCTEAIFAYELMSNKWKEKKSIQLLIRKLIN